MFWNIAAAPLTRLGGVAKSAFEGRFMTEPSRGSLGQTENISILNQLQIDTLARLPSTVTTSTGSPSASFTQYCRARQYWVSVEHGILLSGAA